MICKWCGETLKIGTKTCKRCKHDVPPLSDCGGFYDLVPQAGAMSTATAGEASPAAAPESLPKTAATPNPSVRPRHKKSNTLPNILFWLAIVLALVFVIQTISLSNQLAEAKATAERLQEQVKSQESTEATEETDPTEESTGNSFGEKDHEDTDKTNQDPEPADIAEIILIEGDSAEITLTDASIERLNTDEIQFEVGDYLHTVLKFTMGLRPGAEDSKQIYLTVTEIAEGYTVQSCTWKDNHSKQWNPVDDQSTSNGIAEELPEYTAPISQFGKGEITCTLVFADADGNEMTIVIKNIVIS